MVEYFNNIGELLSSISRWLETDDESDKWWKLQTQVAELCLQELRELLEAQPQTGPVATVVAAPATVLESVGMMVLAMRGRNRAAALASAKVALEHLSDLE